MMLIPHHSEQTVSSFLLPLLYCTILVECTIPYLLSPAPLTAHGSLSTLRGSRPPGNGENASLVPSRPALTPGPCQIQFAIPPSLCRSALELTSTAKTSTISIFPSNPTSHSPLSSLLSPLSSLLSPLSFSSITTFTQTALILSALSVLAHPRKTSDIVGSPHNRPSSSHSTVSTVTKASDASTKSQQAIIDYSPIHDLVITTLLPTNNLLSHSQSRPRRAPTPVSCREPEVRFSDVTPPPVLHLPSLSRPMRGTPPAILTATGTRKRRIDGLESRSLRP